MKKARQRVRAAAVRVLHALDSDIVASMEGFPSEAAHSINLQANRSTELRRLQHFCAVFVVVECSSVRQSSHFTNQCLSVRSTQRNPETRRFFLSEENFEATGRTHPK
jgi:hypothetical protein